MLLLRLTMQLATDSLTRQQHPWWFKPGNVNSFYPKKKFQCFLELVYLLSMRQCCLQRKHQKPRKSITLRKSPQMKLFIIKGIKFKLLSYYWGNVVKKCFLNCKNTKIRRSNNYVIENDRFRGLASLNEKTESKV